MELIGTIVLVCVLMLIPIFVLVQTVLLSKHGRQLVMVPLKNVNKCSQLELLAMFVSPQIYNIRHKYV